MSSSIVERSIDPICTVQELIDHLEALVEDKETTYLQIDASGAAALEVLVIENVLSDGSRTTDISIGEVA